jgi:hypothetical protein
VGHFRGTAVFISSKLCMVTIFWARFVPEFGMNREYRGALRAEKITEGAPRVLWAWICRQTTDERPLRVTESDPCPPAELAKSPLHQQPGFECNRLVTTLRRVNLGTDLVGASRQSRFPKPVNCCRPSATLAEYTPRETATSR